MSQNLLETVQQYFTGDTVRQASSALGESESGVGGALRSIVPLVLGGLFSRSQQPGGVADLFGMAQQAHSSGILNNLSSLLGGTPSAGANAPAADGTLLNRGTELLRSVLGGGYTSAVDSVSQQAGVRTSTVSSLMSMAVPVVLGLLGRHAAQNNLDANSFGSYLNSQKGGIMSALGSLPGNLGNILGGLGLGAAATSLGNAASNLGTSAANTAAHVGNTVSATANRATEAAHNTARRVEETASSPSRWPWLLLLLLGLGALFYFMRGCNKTETTTTTTATVDTVKTVAPAPVAAPTGHYDEKSGNYIYDTGANTTLKLPDGTTIEVGDNSTESRLFNFLNDNNQTVSDDKTQGWISLDRVYFDTGKSTLTAESQAQLKNIAAILKAFPNATLKMGGYTDNQGKADMNQALSDARAKAAMAALAVNGVAADRLAAEGYGQEHPLTTNDTPEGRAQNRRVDVRVTKK